MQSAPKSIKKIGASLNKGQRKYSFLQNEKEYVYKIK